jgi:hypothetical protein
LYVFEQRFPEVEIRRRHGILHPSIGPFAYAKRLVNRAGLAVVGSGPSMAFMRAIGAVRGRRSRLSDLYYYTLFRRRMIAGYAEARREARAASDSSDRLACRLADAAWVDRGESAFERKGDA